MVAIVLIGIMVDRPTLSFRTLTVAALVVLLRAPEAIVHPSFQVSFAATSRERLRSIAYGATEAARLPGLGANRRNNRPRPPLRQQSVIQTGVQGHEPAGASSSTTPGRPIRNAWRGKSGARFEGAPSYLRCSW